MKKNSNLSKELRLLFVAYYEKYIYLYRDGEYESTKKQLEALEKRGINFNTYTLVDLFGVMHRDTPEVRARNRSNARILRRILTEEGLEIILKGKALHKMTYLFGFEKYACRLAHGKLSGRIQAK